MSGGYRKHLKTLLSQLTSSDDIECVFCASPEKLYVSKWIKPTEKIQYEHCKPYKLFSKRDVELHRQLDRFKPDVIFVPLERYFKHRDIPTVCMVRNMLPLIDFKHVNVLETVRNKVQKILAIIAVRKSQRIITLSCFVSEYLQNEWKIPSQKIALVHHGTDLNCRIKLSVPQNISPESSGRYFFTAGSIERYRGFEDIIFAVNRLKKEGTSHIVLVAGSARRAMKSYADKLQRMVSQMGLEENIHWLGNLNDNEMAWCYRNCKAFIMTSRVESFGQTALEAMSHECICISTRNPCLPEVFGDAAIYYNAGNEVELSEQIKHVLLWDVFQKREMSQRALRRAAQFTVSDVVSKTVKELKKAFESS